jgi:RimK-like ATP-grasp domain
MIVLWGLPGDRPLRLVWRALKRLDAQVTLLDQRDALQMQVDLEPGSSVGGFARAGDQAIDLSKVTAAYIRPYEAASLPAVERAGPGSPAWLHAIDVEQALCTWADLTDALIVNRPTAAMTNSSKPYQSDLIRASGFKVPETLITTSPEVALDFWRQQGEVIYKSISGMRSVVSRLNQEHVSRLADVVNCPTQFQAYVPGIDYRVHVVGDEVFACTVRSQADDYRYAGRHSGAVEIHPVLLPDDMWERCLNLAAFLRLHVAGIDLRRTPQDDWYCFEVNPSPGFSYYQDETGTRIDEAIAALLVGGRERYPCALWPPGPGWDQIRVSNVKAASFRQVGYQ